MEASRDLRHAFPEADTTTDLADGQYGAMSGWLYGNINLPSARTPGIGGSTKFVQEVHRVTMTLGFDAQIRPLRRCIIPNGGFDRFESMNKTHAEPDR
jgi:hypothetical protein